MNQEFRKETPHVLETLEAVSGKEVVHVGKCRTHPLTQGLIVGVPCQGVQPDEAMGLLTEEGHLPPQDLLCPQVPAITQNDHHGSPAQ